MEELKKCNHCGRDLPRSQFYKDKNSKDGRTPYCKAYYKAYYESNRDRQLKTNYRARIKKRYGLTVEEYEGLIANGCEVCGPKATTRIVMDHCHATDALRAPLCNNCNVALGAVHDDPEVLQGLIDYLARHATP